MKLTQLVLGLVLASGLFIFGTACGSSDSSNNNNPFGPGGGGGTSGGGGGSISAGGSSGTYSSGGMTCADTNVSCKSGTVVACCSSASQCKIVAAGKDFVCSGSSSNGGCDSAISSALSYCGYN